MDNAFTLGPVMGQDVAGTGAIIEIEEPPAVTDRRVADLQRELRIRDREEQAARREMTRLTEQLMRHSRAARAQVEGARAESASVSELERRGIACRGRARRRALSWRPYARARRPSWRRPASAHAAPPSAGSRAQRHRLEGTRELLKAARTELAEGASVIVDLRGELEGPSRERA